MGFSSWLLEYFIRLKAELTIEREKSRSEKAAEGDLKAKQDPGLVAWHREPI